MRVTGAQHYGWGPGHLMGVGRLRSSLPKLSPECVRERRCDVRAAGAWSRERKGDKFHPPAHPSPIAAISAPVTNPMRSPPTARGATGIGVSSGFGGLISGTHAGGVSGFVMPIYSAVSHCGPLLMGGSVPAHPLFSDCATDHGPTRPESSPTPAMATPSIGMIRPGRLWHSSFMV